jgi:outer membrane autotransporter protein
MIGGTLAEADAGYTPRVVGADSWSAIMLVQGAQYSGTRITAESSIDATAYPEGSKAVWANASEVFLYSSTIATTGLGADSVFLHNGAIGWLENTTVTSSGSMAASVRVQHNGNLTVIGGTIAATGSSATPVLVHNNAKLNVKDAVIISNNNQAAVTALSGGEVGLHDTSIQAPVTGLSVSDGRIFGNNLAMTGAISASNNGDIKLQDSVVSGTASIISVHSNGSVTVTGGTLTSTGSSRNVALIRGDGTINLDNVDTAAAGGISTTGSFTGTATVNLSGGSGLNGDAINSGSGALTVNLDHGTMLGNVANQGDGTLTIILDNDSIGTGGFAGGNLITGSDSGWTFTKDSHGNYGENNGVWNIGDYEVIFDNMIHSGTVTISVNSDTGDGGSITITDTADGEGTVHINTTGNGQADPNKVLPGIVSGDGTEHWQWDPIDWGIDTIIKDGDHFIKNGTSPAGAVLNSSVAIQQAMWFAQQNSLLKRMGELRYGARASRPPAGETPARHIIENIWLRSYGQQLNVGSKVSGKAYEQLIYGVDLGTDHKFTISADSDLYLGVYAGYGRSDIDYRTPGTDGEINSYYGGLYATWLHASGFYIDATFKAASVNNDLKAPYGSTQLTANYSDVNIGGSLEIGKKFTFADDWFIEPQFQVNYLHILAEDYTAGPMTISAQDLDALQLRIGSLFGRTINLTNSGALQPYVKISGVETISSGGTLRNGYQHTRANTDGARAELGGGLIWQLDANNQLHLDYEATFGDKYDKPWGLTAGYRHQF